MEPTRSSIDKLLRKSKDKQKRPDRHMYYRERPGFGKEWHEGPSNYNVGGSFADFDINALLRDAARDALADAAVREDAIAEVMRRSRCSYDLAMEGVQKKGRDGRDVEAALRYVRWQQELRGEHEGLVPTEEGAALSGTLEKRGRRMHRWKPCP